MIEAKPSLASNYACGAPLLNDLVFERWKEERSRRTDEWISGYNTFTRSERLKTIPKGHTDDFARGFIASARINWRHWLNIDLPKIRKRLAEPNL